MNIGENIRTIRLRRGLKQAWTESEAGLPKSTLSKIEKGERDIKVQELYAVAKVLDVSALDLFTYPVHYIPQGGESCRMKAVIELDLIDEQRLRVIKEMLRKENLI